MACPGCSGPTSTRAETCPYCSLALARLRPPSPARSAVAVVLSPATLVAGVAVLVLSAPLRVVVPAWLAVTAWAQHRSHRKRQAWHARLLPRPWG